MTIDDLYENGISIFAELQNKDVPWKNLEISSQLDSVFRYVKAKNLICNSLCEDITADGLAGIIYSFNIENWKKLWQNYTAEYNPIDNYNRHEETTQTDIGSDTLTKNGTTTNVKTGSVTNTRTGTSTNEQAGTMSNVKTGGVTNSMTGSTTSTDTASVFPFNSDSATNVSTGNSTVSPNTTSIDTYDVTDSQNNKLTNSQNDAFNEKSDYENLTDTSEFNSADNHKSDNSRTTVSDISGNIGVTTSAQMINENINLWKWNYFDDVFDSIIRLITTGVYDYG